jgi:hypothetical protein
MASECVHHDIGQDDRPSAPLGLRLEELELSLDPGEGMADPQPSRIEVDVLPAQPEQLSLAAAGPEGGDPQRSQPIIVALGPPALP